MMTRRSFLTGVVASSLYSVASSSTRRVTIGVCSRDAAGAAKCGFDYIEPGAADIAAMSEDDFRAFADKVLATPIRCDAFNSAIRRPDLKVVGNAVSLPALEEYLQSCLTRCHRLGASVVVWGSAGSRNVPEDFPRQRAWDQIAGFLHMAGDISRKHDIIFAIEPLRRKESNILNTGAESLEMVRKVNHPNIKMIIDYYHMREENEDPRIVETAKREIVHLHFANPHGRLWPHDLNEDDHYASFFEYLKKTGFSGGISVEGQGSIENDGAASVAFFHRALSL